MTAADATDLFLARCDRAENRTTAALDVLAVGGALCLHAPTIFAPVHELKVRGWIAAAPTHALGGLHARLTEAGASRSGSERTRRTGIAGRDAASGTRRR